MPQGSFIKNFGQSAANFFFFTGAFFLVVFAAWGAGITVPQNSQLKLNTGKLNLKLDNNSGHVNNAGVIQMTTGEIKLNGNWTTTTASGYILGGSGTVEFAADAGTQYIVPGANSNDTFGDVVHSGSAAVELVAHPIKIGGSFNNNVGTFKTNNLNMQM